MFNPADLIQFKVYRSLLILGTIESYIVVTEGEIALVITSNRSGAWFDHIVLYRGQLCTFSELYSNPSPVVCLNQGH